MEPSREDGGDPWLKAASLIGGVVAALAVYWALPVGDPAAGGLSEPARVVAAVTVLMGVWWMTEALPLEATGLVPLVAFPLFGVSTMQQASAPYADRIIFLFLGGLLLGAAMERWGLHRRLALATLRVAGASPIRLIGGFLAAAAFVSLWVSNTATTAMLLPVAASVAGVVTARLAGVAGAAASRTRAGFGAAVVLAVAYGASIGGVGTIIGTPPVAFLVGHLRETYGIEVTFVAWLAAGLPVVGVMLPLTWVVLTRLAWRIDATPLEGVRDHLRAESARLGPMGRGECIVVGVFVLAAVGWMTAAWTGLDDTLVAMGAALLLFVLPVSVRRRAGGRAAGAESEVGAPAGGWRPVLTWGEASKVPWGVLLLFGGGMSLARGIETSGLDDAIAGLATGLPPLSPLVVLLIFAAAAVLLTEFTTNIALVAAGLPVVGALLGVLDMPAAPLLIVVTLGASLGFMMPAGTAPNAMAFATGRVTIGGMIRAGVLVDAAAVGVATLVVWSLWEAGWLPGV